MELPLRRLARHSLVYGLAGMAASLAGFVLTPIYARFLGPVAYGQLETLLALVQITTILVAAGAGSASLSLIISPKGEPPALVGSAIRLVGLSGLAWLAVGLASAGWLGSLLHVPANAIRLVVLAGVLAAVAQVPYAIWRARGHAWLLAGVTLVQVLLTLACNIFQVAWLGRGAEAILISLILVNLAVALAGSAQLGRDLRQAALRPTVRLLAGIGLMHVINSLATWTMQLSDRFLLASLVPGATLGLYTLGNKISALAVMAFASPLALAWPSFLAQVGRDPTVERQFGRVFEGLVAYAGGLYLVMALPARQWVLLFGGVQYLGAAPMIPILAAAVLVAGLQPVLMSGFGLATAFRLFPVIAIAGALLNVGLNLWWIPLWGAQGAAFATLVAYGASAVLGRIVCERLWPLPIPWPRILATLLWVGVLFGLGQVLEGPAWTIALLGLYAGGVLWRGGWAVMLWQARPSRAVGKTLEAAPQTGGPFTTEPR